MSTDDDDDARSEEREGLWSQIKEIVMFSGPATGIWVCAPIMRVIDTAVIGHGSSLELAALGNSSSYFSNFLIFVSIFVCLNSFGVKNIWNWNRVNDEQ